MMKAKELKELVYNRILEELDRKLHTAVGAMETVKESRDSDTKSSAGDKYETGRAMMQLELEKSEAQWSNTMFQKKELARIDIHKVHTTVEFGSFVETNQGSYFISIGFSKIKVGGKDCFSISLASPIGKLLHHKNIGDEVRFQHRDFEITDIA